MIDKDLLRRLRNDLPMAFAIAALGRDGPPSKMRDGRFCFLCPHCNEMLAYVNPRNNLAHCFHCNMNLNTIDLMQMMRFDVRSAVETLQRWLNEYERRCPKSTADRQ